jgi:hypothetical protein
MGLLEYIKHLSEDILTVSPTKELAKAFRQYTGTPKELPVSKGYYNPNAPDEDERMIRDALTYGLLRRYGSFPIRNDEQYPYQFRSEPFETPISYRKVKRKKKKR